MQSLFKSESGKQEILSLYDQKLETLNIDYRYQLIKTSFGETNIIVSGDDSNPPLMIVHGANACAPISFETYPNLTNQFQVFAVDVIAQPNKSAGTKVSMRDDTYGKWMNEVLTALDLKDVVLLGFSFGGLIILKTLINNEERIKSAYLASPAYIVNGNPMKAFLKVFIPMRLFMITKKMKYIERFLKEVFTSRDEFSIQFLSKVFLNFNMDFTPVPVIHNEEAKKIKTPITLICAKKDLMFPGAKMQKRAKKIFPSLKESILLEDSKHVQNRVDNSKIEELIIRDLKTS